MKTQAWAQDPSERLPTGRQVRPGFRWTGVLAALLSGALHALPCPAHAARDLIGTRALGLGGALRASAAGSASVLNNPAGMSLAQQYVIGSLYQFRSADTSSQAHISIVDSATTLVAAGLAYSYVYASPDRTLATADGGVDLEEKEQTHEVSLSLSVPFGQWFMLGLTTKYVNYQVELSDEVPPGANGPSLSTVGLDIGAIARLGDYVRVAAVGHNVVPLDDQIYPQTLGLGLALAPQPWIMAEFDSVIDFTSDPGGVSASFHGGVEGFFADTYALRLGGQHDLVRDATHLTFGGAFVTRQVGLEVSLRQQIAGGTDTLVAAAIQVYVAQ